MSALKDLMKKKTTDPKGNGLTAVKDLVNASMSKGGKVKAIKVKVKFGSDKGSDKPKKKKTGVTSAGL